MARSLGSSSSLRPVLALLLLTGGCSLFKALTGGGNDQTQGSDGSGYQDYAAQQKAELERQDKALQAEIEAKWKEIDTEGISAERALAITDLTRRAYESGAVQRGTINGPLLGRSTLDHIGEEPVGRRLRRLSVERKLLDRSHHASLVRRIPVNGHRARGGKKLR